MEKEKNIKLVKYSLNENKARNVCISISITEISIHFCVKIFF